MLPYLIILFRFKYSQDWTELLVGLITNCRGSVGVLMV
jgi:hypothetical protein